MTFPHESQLIADIKQGKKQAVESWYRLSRPHLERFFASRMNSDVDAAELVHDTYLSCLKSLPLFRAESGLWGWMLGIARHELADHWRRVYAKKVIRALPFGDEILAYSLQQAQYSENTIQEILQKLPHEISEILQMKYIDGVSVKELATQFGISVSAMQSKLYRAKLIFKEEYERTKILE